MKAWYETPNLTGEIQEQYSQRWELAGRPKDAAIFAVYDSETHGMHCYINPAMSRLFPDLLVATEATECEPQDRRGLPLLVGDESIKE